jgi:hypothetical protein
LVQSRPLHPPSDAPINLPGSRAPVPAYYPHARKPADASPATSGTLPPRAHSPALFHTPRPYSPMPPISALPALLPLIFQITMRPLGITSASLYAPVWQPLSRYAHYLDPEARRSPPLPLPTVSHDIKYHSRLLLVVPQNFSSSQFCASPPFSGIKVHLRARYRLAPSRFPRSCLSTANNTLYPIHPLFAPTTAFSAHLLVTPVLLLLLCSGLVHTPYLPGDALGRLSKVSSK